MKGPNHQSYILSGLLHICVLLVGYISFSDNLKIAEEFQSHVQPVELIQEEDAPAVNIEKVKKDAREGEPKPMPDYVPERRDSTPQPKPEPEEAAPPEPKPKPKVEAESEPEAPLPTPKPKAKPEEKPEPKPEPQPKPKPKKKPEPKKEELDFSDVLKNLQKIENRGNGEGGQPKKVAEPLSQSEINAAKRQIERCWNPPASVRNAKALIVEVRATLSRDGIVTSAKPIKRGFIHASPLNRVAEESAVRAALNPKCHPLKLPVDKYEQWKDITFVFDPKRMVG